MKQLDARRTLKKLGLLLERVMYPLSKRITIVSMIAACMMMFLVTADVLMRRILNMPITGSYEVSCALLSILVFCAVAYVMSVKGHIEVTIITRYFPQRLQRVISGIALFLSLVIVGLISWGSTLYGLYMLKEGEKSVQLALPYAPFIFVVAFGSALLFFVILVQFIHTLTGVKEEESWSQLA